MVAVEFIEVDGKLANFSEAHFGVAGMKIQGQ